MVLKSQAWNVGTRLLGFLYNGHDWWFQPFQIPEMASSIRTQEAAEQKEKRCTMIRSNLKSCLAIAVCANFSRRGAVALASFLVWIGLLFLKSWISHTRTDDVPFHEYMQKWGSINRRFFRPNEAQSTKSISLFKRKLLLLLPNIMAAERFLAKIGNKDRDNSLEATLIQMWLSLGHFCPGIFKAHWASDSQF